MEYTVYEYSGRQFWATRKVWKYFWSIGQTDPDYWPVAQVGKYKTIINFNYTSLSNYKTNKAPGINEYPQLHVTSVRVLVIVFLVDRRSVRNLASHDRHFDSSVRIGVGLINDQSLN